MKIKFSRVLGMLSFVLLISIACIQLQNGLNHFKQIIQLAPDIQSRMDKRESNKTKNSFTSQELAQNDDDNYVSLEDQYIYSGKKEQMKNSYYYDANIIDQHRNEENQASYLERNGMGSEKPYNVVYNQHETDSNSFYKNKFLIFTSYRTGSTFTGELFRQNPKVFYLFEPLKLPSLLSRDTHLQEHIVNYLEDCFQCKFSSLLTDSKKFYPVENNMRKMWYLKIFDQPIQRHGKTMLSDMENICNDYDMHAIKIIRGNRIQSVFSLMEKGVKVIHLVRDPRGTITSRLQIESFKTKKTLESYFKEPKTMASVKSECLRYLSYYDILEGKKIYQDNQKDLLNSQYRLVRYEDIAYNPVKIASDIYSFLNVSMPKDVISWLSKSTSHSENEHSKILMHAYSTFRNSSATAEAWRQKMPFAANLEIQRICGDTLRKFGYRRVYSRTEFRDLSMTLVRDFISKWQNVIT